MVNELSSESDERLILISNLLASYSMGEYAVKGELTAKFDALDTIISGINMLGEEIKESTISRDFLNSVYKALQDLLFTLDLNGKITDCNPSVEQLLGCSREEMLGHELSEFIHFDKENKHTLDTLIHEEPFNKEVSSIEGTYYSTRALLRHVICDISILKNQKSEPSGYLVLTRDVTSKKLADRILLRAMVSTLEEERKRVANDLHDSIGQELAGLRMILSHLLNVSQKAEVIQKAEMDTCLTLIDDTIQGLRDVCYNLLPSSLVNEGLISAIKELKRRLPGEIQLLIITPEFVQNFPLSLQVDLFRIIQEFISNSLKHAKAETIGIAFTEIGMGGIELTIKDDGIGFDVNERTSMGRGLYTINSRAKTFNGIVSMHSSLGEGTELNITFNLETYEEYSTFNR